MAFLRHLAITNLDCQAKRQINRCYLRFRADNHRCRAVHNRNLAAGRSPDDRLWIPAHLAWSFLGINGLTVEVGSYRELVPRIKSACFDLEKQQGSAAVRSAIEFDQMIQGESSQLPGMDLDDHPTIWGQPRRMSIQQF